MAGPSKAELYAAHKKVRAKMQLWEAGGGVMLYSVAASMRVDGA